MRKVLFNIPQDLLAEVDKVAKRYSLDRSSYIRTTLAVAIMEFNSGKKHARKK